MELTTFAWLVTVTDTARTGDTEIEIEAAGTNVDALREALSVYEGEYGVSDAPATFEVVPVTTSAPNALTGICNVCQGPIPTGYYVCGAEHRLEFNESVGPDDRIGKNETAPVKGTHWIVVDRSEDRGGYRAALVSAKGDVRPLKYDDRVYPTETAAEARATRLAA